MKGKIAGIVMSVVVVIVAMYGTALATTPRYWEIPDNVRIVQTTHYDGIKTFNSIGGALASITPVGNDHYVIKVMPGVYTEQVTLKQNVDLVGSGQSATTVTYAGDNTVIAAPDCSIENITITNTGGGGTT